MMRLIKKAIGFFWDKSLLSFFIIGTTNTIIAQLGAQLLLRPFTVRWGETAGYWGPTALMFLLTGIASYFLNRKFSFESEAPIRQSLPRFAIILVVCYVLSFSLSDFLVPAFMNRYYPNASGEWPVRIAMLVAQVIFSTLNYIGQRLWAFSE